MIYGCKVTCSIYRQYKYPKGYKINVELMFNKVGLEVWSKEVRKRANNTCEFCGGMATQAHHIQPKKLEPSYALDPDNGIACCKECHARYGHSEECSCYNIAITKCK